MMACLATTPAHITAETEMGETRRREAAEQISKERFLADNPLCLYCGRPSEEPDHVPPRAYFHNRQWADGYWFPACASCNRATSQSEQGVFAFARIAATNERRIDSYWGS
jgi:5-methylcytosine-specific restriction endonuclease McrA